MRWQDLIFEKLQVLFQNRKGEIEIRARSRIFPFFTDELSLTLNEEGRLKDQTYTSADRRLGIVQRKIGK